MSVETCSKKAFGLMTKAEKALYRKEYLAKYREKKVKTKGEEVLASWRKWASKPESKQKLKEKNANYWAENKERILEN